jgi:prolyl-tRNA synthetase
VILRMSNLLVRTLREDPSDAELPSHRLLVRAGYLRRAAPGGFTWLPLGWLVFRNIEEIIRTEMVAAGAQEVHFPALLPREPYEATGRWEEYGDNVFRVVDRRGADYMLAPTHEELFTLLVKELAVSYKELPLSLFQIQTKYRDEARPRGGLLRAREFVMKDSYSFDLDDEGLGRSYDQHRVAYEKIFTRLGLPYVIVSAMSGAMGGSRSEEFLLPIEIGEDTFARCTTCGYAANTEAVMTPAPAPVPVEGQPAAHVEDTPDTPTIASLVDFLNAHPTLSRPDRPWTAGELLKNVVVRLRHPDGRTETLAIGVPADRNVDLKRLEAAVAPAEPSELDVEDFKEHPELVRGYIGPGVLGASKPAGIRYLVDPRIVTGTRWVTGADEAGRHVVDLVAGRDFEPDGTIDVAEVRAGDQCPHCPGTLELARGVEIGHIFQLGRKYAEALGLEVLDQNGKRVTVTMGSYGIGVSRALACIAEISHDDRGLIWPAEVAPADVHIVLVGKTEAHTLAADDLAIEAEAAGLRVLVDDRRSLSPGVKLTDAELIGVPTIIVVGKGLDRGVVEVVDRRTLERRDVPVSEAVPGLVAAP